MDVLGMPLKAGIWCVDTLRDCNAAAMGARGTTFAWFDDLLQDVRHLEVCCEHCFVRLDPTNVAITCSDDHRGEVVSD